MMWSVYDRSDVSRPIQLLFPSYLEASWVCMHNERGCVDVKGNRVVYLECRDCNKKCRLFNGTRTKVQ